MHQWLSHWRTALLITLAGFCMALIIQTQVESSGQERVTRTLYVTGVTVLSVLAWIAALANIPTRVKLNILAGVGIVAIAAIITFEFRGFTGDLLPLLRPRWHAVEFLHNERPSTSSRSPVKHTETLPTEEVNLHEGEEQVETEFAHLEPPTPVASEFEYPQFLGPSRSATLEDIFLYQDWKARPPRELWRIGVGAGWSSFAVKKGIAVTQEQHGTNEVVTAYELETGRRLWAHETPASFTNVLAGDGPRATPAIVDDRIYTMGATGILTSLKLETGELIWSRSVLEDNQATLPEWGKSCSPLIIDGNVVVSAGGPNGRSLVAYSQLTGDLVWGAGDDQSGYSSPLETTLAGVRQILIFNAASVAAHDPNSGRVLWTYPWPVGQPTVAQPLILPNDRVLLSSGYGIGSKLIQILRMDDGRLEARLIWGEHSPEGQVHEPR